MLQFYCCIFIFKKSLTLISVSAYQIMNLMYFSRVDFKLLGKKIKLLKYLENLMLREDKKWKRTAKIPQRNNIKTLSDII